MPESPKTESPQPAPENPDAPVAAEYIREAWQQCEGDVPAAAGKLYATLAKDSVLLGALLPRILQDWCREQIRHHLSTLRTASLTPDLEQGGARLRSVIAMSLFDFPLPGGKRLGSANREEIARAADEYGQSAQTLGHRARWLAKVAERVGRHNKCETALTLKALEQLFEETRDAE